MPRGGRRRGRRGGRRPKKPKAAPSNRRRRRRRPTGIQAMIPKKQTEPATLPPDGQILEEVIDEFREKYGTPETPQEFRLLLKVPGHDDQEKPAKAPRPKESPKPVQPPDDGKMRWRRRQRNEESN